MAKESTQFDFYEFAGILTPGAIILFGLSLIYPDLHLPGDSDKMNIADLGLFTVLAYAAGHLIQLLGDGIEWLWWKGWGGMPTDWIHDGKRDLINPEQRTRILYQCHVLFGHKIPPEPNAPTGLKDIPMKDWSPLVREIYAAVAKAKRSDRVDAFNRTYGMLRGLVAALVVMTIVLFCKNGCAAWTNGTLILPVLAVAAAVRMHLFGRGYARELFVQFLLVKKTEI